MPRDIITLTVTAPRQALQRAVRLAKQDARVTSSGRERQYMGELAADLERQLNAHCPCCHSSRFVPNPAWVKFVVPDAETAAEIEDLMPLEAARDLFAAKHGPELLPCPKCRKGGAS